MAVKTKPSVNGKKEQPKLDLEKLSLELVSLQRQRSVVMKSRNMQQNRLRALVAGEIGYSNKMEEKDRSKKFKEADAKIKEITAGGGAGFRFREIVLTSMIGIKAFDDARKEYEKQINKIAKKLPVADWVQSPEQRGFGLKFLGYVIGETGDLRNYANPAKVWKRLGCAPWTFSGHTAMGATWKHPNRQPCKLPKQEWEAFGYSPRRRSLSWLIGVNIVRQNFIGGIGNETEAVCADEVEIEDGGDTGETGVETESAGAGPYRSRYLQAKKSAAEKHPDWTPQHCNFHGMLVATKLLLKNLWIEWNGKPKDLELWKQGKTESGL